MSRVGPVIPEDVEPITRSEFASRVRSRIPSYADLSDDQIVDAAVAKFPIYNELIKPDEPRLNIFQRAGQAVGGVVNRVLDPPPLDSQQYLFGDITIPSTNAIPSSLEVPGSDVLVPPSDYTPPVPETENIDYLHLIPQPRDREWNEETKQWELPAKGRLQSDIRQSFIRGNIRSHLDTAGFNLLLTGDPDKEEALLEAQRQLQWLEENDPTRSGGWIRRGIVGTSDMLPAFIKGSAQGFIIGAGAAKGAALFGQAGPQAALPEEMVTVPAAFGTGKMLGSAQYWYRQGAGGLYLTMRDEGVDRDIAAIVSAGAGVPYAAVEFMQAGKIIPGLRKSMDKAVMKSVKRTIAQAAKEFGADWAVEVTEEVIQELILMAAQNAAAELNDHFRGSEIDKIPGADILRGMWETAVESAIPLFLLMAPRSGLEVSRRIRNTKAQQAADATPPPVPPPPVPAQQETPAQKQKLKLKKDTPIEKRAAKIEDTVKVLERQAKEWQQYADDAQSPEGKQAGVSEVEAINKQITDLSKAAKLMRGEKLDSPIKPQSAQEAAVEVAVAAGISEQLERAVQYLGRADRDEKAGKPVTGVKVDDTLDVAWAGNPREGDTTRLAGTARVVAISADGTRAKLEMDEGLVDNLPTTANPSVAILNLKTGLIEDSRGRKMTGVAAAKAEVETEPSVRTSDQELLSGKEEGATPTVESQFDVGQPYDEGMNVVASFDTTIGLKGEDRADAVKVITRVRKPAAFEDGKLKVVGEVEYGEFATQQEADAYIAEMLEKRRTRDERQEQEAAVEGAEAESKPPELMTPEEAIAYKADIDARQARLVTDELTTIDLYGKDSAEAQEATQVLKDFQAENATWAGAGGAEVARGIQVTRIKASLAKQRPVNAAAVDAYGITLPEGYVLDGDTYVFRGAEAEAPAIPAAPVTDQGGRRGMSRRDFFRRTGAAAVGAAVGGPVLAEKTANMIPVTAGHGKIIMEALKLALSKSGLGPSTQGILNLTLNRLNAIDWTDSTVGDLAFNVNDLKTSVMKYISQHYKERGSVAPTHENDRVGIDLLRTIDGLRNAINSATGIGVDQVSVDRIADSLVDSVQSLEGLSPSITDINKFASNFVEEQFRYNIYQGEDLAAAFPRLKKYVFKLFHQEISKGTDKDHWTIAYNVRNTPGFKESVNYYSDLKMVKNTLAGGKEWREARFFRLLAKQMRSSNISSEKVIEVLRNVIPNIRHFVTHTSGELEYATAGGKPYIYLGSIVDSKGKTKHRYALLDLANLRSSNPLSLYDRKRPRYAGPINWDGLMRKKFPSMMRKLGGLEEGVSKEINELAERFGQAVDQIINGELPEEAKNLLQGVEKSSEQVTPETPPVQQEAALEVEQPTPPPVEISPTDKLNNDIKVQALARKYNMDMAKVAKILEADPTPQKSYREWLVKQVKKGNLRFPEDAEKTKTRLEQFDRLKKTPRFQGDKDINRYKTFSDLAKTMDEYVDTKSKRQERVDLEQEGVEDMFGDIAVKADEDTGDYKVLKVTTKEASHKLCQGTDWCTAVETYADRYLRQGPLYQVRKSDGTPLFQIHFESDQINDVNDTPIGRNDLPVAIIRDVILPILKKDKPILKEEIASAIFEEARQRGMETTPGDLGYSQYSSSILGKVYFVPEKLGSIKSAETEISRNLSILLTQHKSVKEYMEESAAAVLGDNPVFTVDPDGDGTIQVKVDSGDSWVIQPVKEKEVHLMAKGESVDPQIAKFLEDYMERLIADDGEGSYEFGNNEYTFETIGPMIPDLPRKDVFSFEVNRIEGGAAYEEGDATADFYYRMRKSDSPTSALDNLDPGMKRTLVDNYNQHAEVIIGMLANKRIEDTDFSFETGVRWYFGRMGMQVKLDKEKGEIELTSDKGGEWRLSPVELKGESTPLDADAETVQLAKELVDKINHGGKLLYESDFNDALPPTVDMDSENAWYVKPSTWEQKGIIKISKNPAVPAVFEDFLRYELSPVYGPPADRSDPSALDNPSVRKALVEEYSNHAEAVVEAISNISNNIDDRSMTLTYGEPFSDSLVLRWDVDKMGMRVQAKVDKEKGEVILVSDKGEKWRLSPVELKGKSAPLDADAETVQLAKELVNHINGTDEYPDAAPPANTGAMWEEKGIVKIAKNVAMPRAIEKFFQYELSKDPSIELEYMEHPLPLSYPKGELKSGNVFDSALNEDGKLDLLSLERSVAFVPDHLLRHPAIYRTLTHTMARGVLTTPYTGEIPGHAPVVDAVKNIRDFIKKVKPAHTIDPFSAEGVELKRLSGEFHKELERLHQHFGIEHPVSSDAADRPTVFFDTFRAADRPTTPDTPSPTVTEGTRPAAPDAETAQRRPPPAPAPAASPEGARTSTTLGELEKDGYDLARIKSYQNREAADSAVSQFRDSEGVEFAYYQDDQGHYWVYQKETADSMEARADVDEINNLPESLAPPTDVPDINMGDVDFGNRVGTLPENYTSMGMSLSSPNKDGVRILSMSDGTQFYAKGTNIYGSKENRANIKPEEMTSKEDIRTITDPISSAPLLSSYKDHIFKVLNNWRTTIPRKMYTAQDLAEILLYEVQKEAEKMMGVGLELNAEETNDMVSKLRQEVEAMIPPDVLAESDSTAGEPGFPDQSGPPPIPGVVDPVFDVRSPDSMYPIRPTPKPVLDTSAHQMVDPGKKPVSIPDVIKSMENVLDHVGKKIPIRVGHVGPQKHGSFKTLPEVIRVREANDIPIAVHELGHALEKIVLGGAVKSRQSMPNSARMELMALGKALYGKTKPQQGYVSEGFAEFVRLYLTTDKDAKVQAPNVHAWFENSVLGSNKQFARNLNNVKQLIEKYRYQGSEKRIQALQGKPARFLDSLRRMFSKDSLQTNWVDEFNPLHKLSQAASELKGVKELPIQDDPFKVASALRMTHHSRTRYMVERGMVDLAGNVTGLPLNQIKSLVRNQRQEFTNYLLARRAKERINKGMDPGITLQDADTVIAEYESKYPKFPVAAEMVYAWNKGILEYARQGGLISDAQMDRILSESNDYVPMSRIFDVEDSPVMRQLMSAGVFIGDPIKRYKGSGRQVRDVFQTIIENSSRMIRRTHEKAIVDTIVRMKDIEGMGEFVEKVPRSMVPSHLTLENIKSQLEAAGVDIAGADLETELIHFVPAQRAGRKDVIIPVMEGDSLSWYQVSEDVYQSLHQMDIYRLPKFFDFLIGAPVRTFRMGTTSMRPSFMLATNWIRDLPTFLMQTHSNRNVPAMFGTWMKNFAEILHPTHHGKAFDMFQRLGGEMSQPLNPDTNPTKRVAKNLFHGKTFHVVHTPIDVIRDFLQIPESATRAAEVSNILIELGIDPDGPLTYEQSLQILLAAKRVTVDFSAAGKMGKVVNQLVPFFNASIQGLRSFMRTAKQHPLRSVVRGLSYMTIPTIGLWWKNKDEEWYEDMQWWEKFMYWNVQEGDDIWRIPRPFDWGTYFSMVPEILLNSWYRQNPEEVIQALQPILATHFPVDIPHGLKVPYELGANKNTFTGSPIVPRGEMDLPAAEQKGPYTSQLAGFLGKVFNVSPRKVDHGIRGVFGGLGSDIIDAVGLGHGRTVEGDRSSLPIFGRLFRQGGVEGTRSKTIDTLYEEYSDQVSRRAVESRNGIEESSVDRIYRLTLYDATRAISVLNRVQLEVKKRETRGDLQRAKKEIAQNALAFRDDPLNWEQAQLLREDNRKEIDSTLSGFSTSLR